MKSKIPQGIAAAHLNLSNISTVFTRGNYVMQLIDLIGVTLINP